MKSNSHAYNRDVSRRKALRRKRISKEVDGITYPALHCYSKNKIHCSCPMCSAKSKNRGARRKRSWNWEPTYNWKISDWRKIEAMNADKEEADV